VLALVMALDSQGHELHVGDHVDIEVIIGAILEAESGALIHVVPVDLVQGEARVLIELPAASATLVPPAQPG